MVRIYTAYTRGWLVFKSETSSKAPTAIRRISVETETAIASTSKTIRKLILFKGAGLIAAKLHQSSRSRIAVAVAAVESSFPLILCHHARPRVQFTARKKLFSTITSTAAALYGRALLSSTLFHLPLSSRLPAP